MLTKTHPKADIRHIEVFGQRVNLIMTGQVAGEFTHHWQIISALDFKHFIAGPLAILPSPDLTCELTKVNFWVKVSSKIMAVVAGIDINNIDGVDGVEVIFLRECCIGIDDAWIKTHA